MSGRFAIVVTALGLLHLAGCLAEEGDGVVRQGETETLHGNLEFDHDLVVKAGGKLKLENARVIVHGDAVLNGHVTMTNSDLIIRSDGKPRGLVIDGGLISGRNSNIVGADAIQIRNGQLMLQDGTLIFGRLLASNSEVNFVNVGTESIDQIRGSYDSSTRYSFRDSSRGNMTDSNADGSYFIDSESAVEFLSSTISLTAFSGPGRAVVANRLNVTALHIASGPAANVTIQSTSLIAGTVDGSAITDKDGRATLGQIVAVWSNEQLQLHDPHIVSADSVPFGASLAYQGDSSLTAFVP